jgi:hypothetical protein
MSEETVKVPKETTQREYIYGDFDKDGIKNIDDLHPFRKDTKEELENEEKNPEFWKKSQLHGGEVKLSNELHALERYNNKFSQPLKRFD